MIYKECLPYVIALYCGIYITPWNRHSGKTTIAGICSSQFWHTFWHSVVKMVTSTYAHETVRFIQFWGHISVIFGHSYPILRLSLLWYLFGGSGLISRHRSDKIDHFNHRITYYHSLLACCAFMHFSACIHMEIGAAGNLKGKSNHFINYFACIWSFWNDFISFDARNISWQ